MRCRITAMDTEGNTAELDTAAVSVTYAPPSAAGELFDEVYDQGAGPQTIDAGADFTGDDLSFSVTGAGASINPETGLVTISTATATEGTEIEVSATNSGGTATSAFMVTVEAEEVETASSVTVPVNGGDIVFTFDQAYLVRQAADGSWFVEGPVTVTSVTPESTIISGSYESGDTYSGRPVHGAMLDPGNYDRYAGGSNPDNENQDSQGFDEVSEAPGYSSWQVGYDDTLNVDPGNTGSPLTVQPGTTVVKALSDTTDLDNTARGILLDFACLTVVDTLPPANSFRPAQSVGDKTSPATVADMDLSILSSEIAPASTPVIANLGDPFITWSVHVTSGTAKMMIQPQTVGIYGRDQGKDLGELLLALHLDISAAEKERIAIQVVQLGIDIDGRMAEGGEHIAKGGLDQGTKGVAVMAALLLDDPDMLNRVSQGGVYAEDKMIFAVDQGDLDKDPGLPYGVAKEASGSGYTVGDVLTAIGGVAKTPLEITVDAVDGSGAITDFTPNTPVYYQNPYTADMDGGSGSGAKFRGKRPLDKYMPGMKGEPEWEVGPSDHGSNYYAVYRHAWNGSVLGSALAIRMTTGGTSAWNHPEFFAYMERARYMPQPQIGSTNGTPQFTVDMWDAYRAYGTAAPVLTGSGLDGRFLWLEFDSLLDEGTVPAASEFRAGGTPTVTNVRPFGHNLVLYLSEAYASGDSVSVDYPGTTLKGTNGVQVATFSEQVRAGVAAHQGR